MGKLNDRFKRLQNDRMYERSRRWSLRTFVATMVVWQRSIKLCTPLDVRPLQKSQRFNGYTSRNEEIRYNTGIRIELPVVGNGWPNQRYRHTIFGDFPIVSKHFTQINTKRNVDTVEKIENYVSS